MGKKAISSITNSNDIKYASKVTGEHGKIKLGFAKYFSNLFQSYQWFPFIKENNAKSLLKLEQIYSLLSANDIGEENKPLPSGSGMFADMRKGNELMNSFFQTQQKRSSFDSKTYDTEKLRSNAISVLAKLNISYQKA